MVRVVARKSSAKVAAPFDRAARDALVPVVVRVVEHRGANRLNRRHYAPLRAGYAWSIVPKFARLNMLNPSIRN